MMECDSCEKEGPFECALCNKKVTERTEKPYCQEGKHFCSAECTEIYLWVVSGVTQCKINKR